jgi:AcrR family transcriptional regulator
MAPPYDNDGDPSGRTSASLNSVQSSVNRFRCPHHILSIHDAMTEATSNRRTDGQATRERILEAAGELFAADGYAQTTAKAIADRAEVSLTLINYHFDGREGLYRAVLIEAHRRLGKLSDLRDLAESELPATAKLRVLIYGLVRPATKRQPGWHINVLAREIFAPSANFPSCSRPRCRPNWRSSSRSSATSRRSPSTTLHWCAA